MKSLDLLVAGANAQRVMGAVKRFVSLAFHPDKCKNDEMHLMKNVNNAFDEAILELKSMEQLDWEWN